ncbi:hypothetical protein VU07_00380 [Desulfobulbus sp. F4]|nr:hypothetical protein [Desulfobulbus sp. F3]MCW5200264.1 hypothetical protein [Desulfobulbus sp. F4]
MAMPSLIRNLFSVRPLHGLCLETALPAEDEEPAKGRAWLFILLLAAFFGACHYFLIFNNALIELDLETDTRTVLKFYWPNQRGNYSENKSAQIVIKPGLTQYALRVTDIASIDHLRFDPSENKAAEITIRRIAVQQNGFPLWELRSWKDFSSHLRAVADVDAMTPLENGGISLSISRHDSKLALSLPKRERHVSWSDELKHGLVMLLLAVGCFWTACLFARRLDFIPLLAVFVLALILVMAAISGFNTHPDEYVHVAAGKYYEKHTLPPRVGDSAIVDTYSPYGVSRLQSGEIYYLLAGKYLRFLNPFGLESYAALRLLNVLLFLSLILLAFLKAEFRFFLLSMLISPQIWYIFSYVDSEALSVVLCLTAAWQLAGADSALNTLLRDDLKHYDRWVAPFWLGLLFGLLLLQKQNFYFLYVFFFLYFLWRIRIACPVWSKRTLARFTALVMTGCLLFSTVKVADAWVNDFQKGELLLAAREQYAEPMYKPSTPLEKKHPYLQLRDRGVSLKHMLNVERWGEKSFWSAFGLYGYTQHSAPSVYYDYVRVVGGLLLLTLAVSAIWRGGLFGITLLGLAAGWTVFFLAGLLHHAWTKDFQAQGRYFLPMMPMLAILCYHFQRILIKPIFYSLFFLLFLLSVYNFVFVGLHDIGKAAL